MLIRSGGKNILVDPSLPGRVLDARLSERGGLTIGDIDMVFLTNFRGAHSLGLPAFDGANWLMHADEIDYAHQYLYDLQKHQNRTRSQETRLVEDQLSILEKIKPAGDSLAEGVDLFPSPGSTVGNCALILTQALGTIVIAGDAIVNRDYLQRGQVHENCYDAKRAVQSMQDVLEVADIIIPGHDNLIPMMGKLAYHVGG